MNRNDAGFGLAEAVVGMTISSLLLAGVLSTMFLSVKLVNTAPSDTNPHTFGVVAAAVARLEGSATADLTCTNPSGVNSRRDCLEIESASQAPTTHQGDLCWVVATGEGRRRECWELLPQGDLVAYLYEPEITSTPPDPPAETCSVDELASKELAKDCLTIPAWQTAIYETLPMASGLAALEWNSDATPVTLRTCAAIRPDQRRLMAPDEVPFCDGETGLYLNDGTPRPGIEGYPMPTLRVFS